MAVEIKFVDHVKEGLGVFTSNLVPSLVMLVMMCVPILNIFAMINYMSAVKAFKESGKAIEIGDMLKFDHAVNHLIGAIVWGVVLSIGFTLCVLPGMAFAAVTYFFLPILADKPETPWADALKASLAFGKKNAVPSIILMIVCGLTGMFFITMPIGLAAHMLAYLAHKSEIAAAAAEGGITL